MPRFRIPNSRSTRRVQVTWVPQRYLEMLLLPLPYPYPYPCPYP